MEIRMGICIKRKLVENFKRITNSNGYAKAKHLIQRVNLLREKELLDSIYNDLQQIRDDNNFWVITDNLGSGFDTRFTDISWMDTR